MQVLDMRAFRLLYAQKQHLLPKFSRQFVSTSPKSIRSSNYLYGKESTAAIEAPVGWTTSKSETQTNPKVSAVYNPIAGSLVTKREADGTSDEQQQEPIPSNVDDNRSYGSAAKTNSRSGSQNWRSFGGISGIKKKGKVKTSWVCEKCGYSDGQWWGSCRSCNSAGTMKQFSESDYGGGKTTSGLEVSEDVVRSWLPQQAGEAGPMRLTDVNRGINHMEWRIPL